jgi:hypothetical protein
MSLWSNDGQVAEAALVGVWVTLRRVGRNGGPETPIDPAPLEAALAEFVAGSAELHCWVSADGVSWHAELRWTEGVPWHPVAPLPAEALAQDIAAFAAWAERVAAWVRSKPVRGLPSTTVGIKAEYGKSWSVPLAGREAGPTEPSAAADRPRD